MSGDQKTNTLHYGDCLDILKTMPDESVDLIYLDPPFNSKQDYNLLFSTEHQKDLAQIRAFNDTWYWQATIHEPIYEELTGYAGTTGQTVEALHIMLGKCGMLAYLLFMIERLIELKRVLKTTGSIYLHCDTSAIHYLKIAMDSIFGSNAYRNDITWKRATSHNDAGRFGRISDRILFFTKSDTFTWNGKSVRLPRRQGDIENVYPSKDDRGRYRSDNLTGPSHGQTTGESTKPWKGYDVITRGRVWSAPKTGDYAKYIDEHFIPNYLKIEGVHDRLDALDEAGLIQHPQNGFWPGLKRYAEADTGTPMQDIILEPIGFTNYSANNGEYLDYPTQKPIGLLKPLIELSSNKGDVVLDPFCGCGTAIDAAESLERQWIGIDVSCLAVDIVLDRMIDSHGADIINSIDVKGVPKDMPGARKLFKRDKLEFERWVVGTLLKALPNQVQVGDGGSDGTLYFLSNKKGRQDMGVISVKGGKQINPAMVRELSGTVTALEAKMGILVTMDGMTDGMLGEVNKAGTWKHISGNTFPRVQIITVKSLLEGEKPNMPTPLPRTNRRAKKQRKQGDML